ncbi:unnamed protein product [Ambrosiozyma monospora]|uniref:Unnamed protein product n=1 Tax=Ambrosiozyma monospora TaxID=43982 RepID=A0ACB5T9Z2_AMBMO|nr:unnamed protein product [Ambrosiozyma monospora]
MHINTIDSDLTNLPYSYYSLPFICPPSQHAKPVHLSLGEVLNGDRIWQSDYYLTFEKDDACRRLCDRIASPNAIKRAAELVKQEYMVEWLIDGLPGATTFIKPKTATEKEKKYYVAGFPLGFVENDVAYLHNHVMFVIRWHKENGNPKKKTIVGFEVYPKSVSDYHCPGASKNFANFPLNTESTEKTLIQYTYSVYWREEKDVTYNNRWKMYINPEVGSDDGKMHWFAIINSLVIVSLLTLVVAVVFLRTLKVDISSKKIDSDSSNASLLDKSHPQSQGWRSIAQDVFIQPTWPVLLSALGGSGIQLTFTILGVCILLTTGISGPDHRILSTAIGMFVVGGFFAGYSGVQLFKLVSYQPNQRWKAVSFLAGSLLTGFVLTVILILNLIIWLKDSSLALPFGTIVLLIVIYVLLEIPISMIGGFISSRLNLFTRIMKSRVPNVEPPINKAVAASRIPRQPFYNNLFISCHIITCMGS